MSPLCLALACFEPEVCNLLLELGASLEPSPARLGRYYGTFEAIVRWCLAHSKRMSYLHKSKMDSLFIRISSYIESNKMEESPSELQSGSHHNRDHPIVQEETNIGSSRSSLNQSAEDDVCVGATHQSDETSISKSGISATSFASGSSLEEYLSSIHNSKMLRDRDTDLNLALATGDVELLIRRIEYHQKRSRESRSPMMMAHVLRRLDIIRVLHKKGFKLYPHEVVQFYSESTNLARELLGPIKHHPISVSRARLLSAFVEFLDNKGFPILEEMDNILNNANTEDSDILARATSLVALHKQHL